METRPLLQEQNVSLLPFDLETDSLDEENGKFVSRQNVQSIYRLFSIAFIMILCLAVGFVFGTAMRSFTPPNDISNAPKAVSGSCGNIAIRREWRSLSENEKQNYIDAVQCTRKTPSLLRLNQSLYDDFPYVHMTWGEPGTPMSSSVLLMLILQPSP